MLNWSNITLSEKIDMGLIPECVRIQIEELQARNEQLEKAKKLADRNLELTEEQLYFAQTLIEEYDILVKDCTTLKQLRKAYAIASDNSYYER